MAFEFDTSGVLSRLKALVEADPVVEAVSIGFPATWPTRFSAFVGMAGQSMDDESNGVLSRTSRWLVMTGYRTSATDPTSVETAELAIAAFLDRLFPALYGDAPLNSLLAGLNANSDISDTAEYQMYAGQEVRLYGVSVHGMQVAGY